jgi:hypothetical protein
MADDRFTPFNNEFTWYEWSFVAPDHLPDDDLRVEEERDAQHPSPWSRDVREPASRFQAEEARWMT